MGGWRQAYSSAYSKPRHQIQVSNQRHAPAVLFPRQRTPRYPLDRRLGGPERWSGHRGYRRNHLPLPGTEHRTSSLVRHCTDWATPAKYAKSNVSGLYSCWSSRWWLACLPLDIVCRFSPGRERWIFKGDKNPQHAFLRRGSKAVGSMSLDFTAHWNPFEVWTKIIREAKFIIFFAQFLLFC
jgi:hypothetical protein